MRLDSQILLVSNITIMRNRLSRIVKACERETRVVSYRMLAQDLSRGPQSFDLVLADLTAPGEFQSDMLLRLLAAHPIRMTVIYGESEESKTEAERLLASGAVQSIFVERTGEHSLTSEEKQREILLAMEKATRIRTVRPRLGERFQISENADSYEIPSVSNADRSSEAPALIAIAGSTGGPDAIRSILARLDQCHAVPPVVIVQHMHGHFTSVFANELNVKLNLKVELAEHRGALMQDTVYLCPGDQHLALDEQLRFQLLEQSEGGEICPSSDIFFESLAAFGPQNSVCVILSGMGQDGTLGLGSARRKGMTTIAQDPQTCAVDMMPKSAIAADAIDRIYSPLELGNHLQALCENPILQSA